MTHHATIFYIPCAYTRAVLVTARRAHPTTSGTIGRQQRQAAASTCTDDPAASMWPGQVPNPHADGQEHTGVSRLAGLFKLIGWCCRSRCAAALTGFTAAQHSSAVPQGDNPLQNHPPTPPWKKQLPGEPGNTLTADVSIFSGINISQPAYCTPMGLGLTPSPSPNLTKYQAIIPCYRSPHSTTHCGWQPAILPPPIPVPAAPLLLPPVPIPIPAPLPRPTALPVRIPLPRLPPHNTLWQQPRLIRIKTALHPSGAP